MSEKPLADEPAAFRKPEDTPTVVRSSSGDFELQLTPGTILADRYRIVSLLGRGGMGEVYRADDLKLGQAVALKFLSRGLQHARLYEEVRIGRQISHPNVCRLHDIAEIAGRPFITMEFVDGEDLASLLRRIGRLPQDKALSVMRDLCAGLSAAHEKGVIHRDLKPGNVMIDGRGRARITDFGLAVAERSAREHVSAGTPAYMAPEQLAGEAATVQSDIYALGLMVYELFTGRRAFETSSLTELLEWQREARFTKPSSLLSELDPRVERAMLHALDPDPSARPSSVDALAAELPYYDPMKAALAAGETPTPGMVAAAGAKGDLSPAVAWTLLLITLAGLVLAVALSSRTMLLTQITGLKPPQVLLERAREIVADAGLTETPADSFHAYYFSPDYRSALARGDAAVEQSTATPIGFYYRQSPRPLVATNWRRRIWQDDPPLVWSGMADVQLGATGLLRAFAIVPPHRESAAARPVDWSRLMQHAGVDVRSLIPVKPEWSASVDSDEKRAWLIGTTGMRIEAAAYHGRPVSFDVIAPWETPWRMLKPKGDVVLRLQDVVMGIFAMVVPITALFLARRNLLRGQGDRRGALRLAIVFFIALSAALLLRADHVTSFLVEWGIVIGLVALAAFFSALLAIAYIAVEPLVRRRWPHMLISWTRVLNGQFGDAMVGRDLLVGAVGGVLFVTLWHLTAIAPAWFGFPAAPLQKATWPLTGVRYAATYFAQAIAGVLLVGIGWLTVLLLLRAITRRDRIAAAIVFLMMATWSINDGTGPLSFRIAYAILTAAVALTLLLRFGILAFGSAFFFIWLLQNIPLTFDPAVWYFGRSAVTLLVLAAVASYGFYVSVRGKAFLPRLAFES